MSDDKQDMNLIRDDRYKGVPVESLKERVCVSAATAMTIRCYLLALMSGRRPSPQLTAECQHNGMWVYGHVKDALKGIPEDDAEWIADTANSQLNAMYHMAAGLEPDGKSKRRDLRKDAGDGSKDDPKPEDEQKGGEDA